MNNNKMHYFVSSFASWNTGSNLEEVLKRQAEDDKGLAKTCNIFKVPLHEDDDYALENYQPVVEGVEFLGKHNHIYG